MQVFGLPGHLIRNAGRASRLLGAETLNDRSGEKTRCGGALATRHGCRTECRRRGCCGRRSAFDPLPLEGAAAAEEPASAPTARQRLVTCAALCGRAAEMRLPDVGQGQAGPAPAQGRHGRLQRHGRAHPQKPGRARPGDAGSTADPQTSAQSRAQKPGPMPSASRRTSSSKSRATSSRSIR